MGAERGRTGGLQEEEKKEEEEQTCIPLFLLKETEEAKETKQKEVNRELKQRDGETGNRARQREETQQNQSKRDAKNKKKTKQKEVNRELNPSLV